jgi:hypothetical protein
MEIVCTKCGKKLGMVEAVARLLLTVHCPFDGTDFGVAVDPPEPAAAAPAAGEKAAPA